MAYGVLLHLSLFPAPKKVHRLNDRRVRNRLGAWGLGLCPFYIWDPMRQPIKKKKKTHTHTQ